MNFDHLELFMLEEGKRQKMELPCLDGGVLYAFRVLCAAVE